MNSALIFRLSSRYILRRVALAAPLFGGDLMKALVAGVVAQANLGHLARDPDLTRRWGGFADIAPSDLRRPISASAVAAALGAPRETVRRKVKDLIASGYLTEQPVGLVVNATDASTSEAIEILAGLSALTDQFCAELADANHAGPFPERPITLHRAAIRISTAYDLRFFEELGIAADGDLMGGLTFLALNTANVRHLDWKAMPPGQRFIAMSERRPATALSLAAELLQPRETLRRQLSRIVAMGYARRQAGGVVADPSRLPAELVDRILARNEINLRPFLASLRQLEA